MAILFPVCVYASKMSMLIVTYMKVFRMERSILQVNLLGVLIAVITTVISVYILKNLFLAVVAILINQMLRCVAAEIVLSKRIHQSVIKDIVIELLLTTSFVVFSWYVSGLAGMLLYLAAFIIYLYVKRNVFSNLSSIMKSR